MTSATHRLLTAIASCLCLQASAQTHTYDFVWYSGASQTWVYEAGPKLMVEVYEDPTTPENDVFFRFRNAIDTELGYQSSISDLQFDTGSIAPDMFAEVSLRLSDSQGSFSYRMYPPGTPQTLIDLSASRVAWSGDFAAGRTSDASKEFGINPGEYLVLRGLLRDGLGFEDVINALNVGVSSAYAEGIYSTWTTSQKTAYRSGASQGLRIALLVHSIVPNTWNPDGHGLFVTHRRVASVDESAPSITSLTATPVELLDTQTSQLEVLASDPQPGPQALSYQWSVVSGGGTLSALDIANPVYTPADVTGSREVVVRVEVSDGANVVTRTLTLRVSDADAPVPNVAPQIMGVSAAPATILDNETSQLSVTAGDPDGGPQGLGYQWTIVGGAGVLDDATSATPLYTPADVVGAQTVTLRVDVTDGAATVSENLTLTVQDADPPPPVTELLANDFSVASLAGWSVRDEGSISAPSKWQVKSGELAQLSNINDASAASALPKLGTYLLYDEGLGWTDYRLKFRLRSTDDDSLGALFRYIDANNYYRFSWDKQQNQRRLVKKAGGVYTLLAADNVPYVMGQAYQVEIVAQGDQLEVWIDGVRVFQVSDPAHNRGSVAFYSWQNNGAYFDDLVVEDLSGGTFNALPKITVLTASPATILDTGMSNLTVEATDPDDGPQALSYQWTIVSGAGVLDNASSATPTYTPADGVGTQTVHLKVEVSDGAATVSGNLTLTVEDANPPPLGPELLYEDFSATLTGWSVHDEGTISSPSKWQVKSGELAQLSNIRDGSTTNDLAKRGTYLLYGGGADWTDYRAKFRLRATDDDTLGVMFRVRDADNYYRFSWDKQLNQRRLVKKAGGVYTLLAADNVPYVVGQNYQVEVIAQGGLLEVWIDGARIFQVSDTAHDQGSIAFYTWQNNAAFFDDIQVNAIE